MKRNPFFDHSSPPVHAGSGKERWRKINGDPLTISVVLHLIVLMLAALWMFNTTRETAKEGVDLSTKRDGGGGSPATALKDAAHRVRMLRPNMSRVAARGLFSRIVLPEPPKSSRMSSLTAPDPLAGMSNGRGGDGSGGGLGNGFGNGTGDGFGPRGSFRGLFGMIDLDSRDGLVGTFYDLKQTLDRQPTGMDQYKMREALKEITRRGLGEDVLGRYFKAPRKLYQTRLYIPTIPAALAPAAFGVEKDVQPGMWVVVYRGAVKAPKSGKFRFVGESDDVLVIRFDGRPVFDYGYTMSGIGMDTNGNASDFDGRTTTPELAGKVRELTPMSLPITFYKYAATPQHNRTIGGYAVGPEFEVAADQIYPVEIMIGEIPGGSFSVEILLEETGAAYRKDPAGFPILPLFRMDHLVPKARRGGPPFDPNGPVWPFIPGGPLNSEI